MTLTSRCLSWSSRFGPSLGMDNTTAFCYGQCDKAISHTTLLTGNYTHWYEIIHNLQFCSPTHTLPDKIFYALPLFCFFICIWDSLGMRLKSLCACITTVSVLNAPEDFVIVTWRPTGPTSSSAYQPDVPCKR